jgi:hypothetical protein
LVTDITAKQEQVEAGRKAEIALEVVKPFLADLCKEHERQALKALASVWPWARRRAASHAARAEAIMKLAQYLTALIANGQSAEGEIARIRKVEALSPERRKALGIGVPA